MCINCEKQIALAVHNYLSLHKNTFPPAYTTDKHQQAVEVELASTDPCLSSIATHSSRSSTLTSPWDSEHNRALIAKLPQVYRCPMEDEGECSTEGKTRYIAPREPGAIFRGAEPVKINEITDGTSNTIMFIEADDKHAVTWTKPDDWEVSPDPKAISAGVLTAHTSRQTKGSNCAFADGPVRLPQQMTGGRPFLRSHHLCRETK